MINVASFSADKIKPSQMAKWLQGALFVGSFHTLGFEWVLSSPTNERRGHHAPST